MQRSSSAGSRPVSTSSSTASNRYGNSSRLTTKPGVSGTSTGVLPSSSHRARARARTSSCGLGGEDELDQLHPRHRVEDVQADEPLGPAGGGGQRGHRQRGRGGGQARRRRPPPCPSRRADSPCGRCPRPRPRPGRWPGRGPSRSVTIDTRSEVSSSPASLAQCLATAAVARWADASERAHSTTSPCWAAVAASPHAIVPAPAMASRSCKGSPGSGWARGAITTALSVRNST